MWDLTVKSPDKTTLILKLLAEQEFIMVLDENKDKEILINLISTSHMHFEEEMRKIISNTGMANYSLKWVDFQQTADNILRLVR